MYLATYLRRETDHEVSIIDSLAQDLTLDQATSLILSHDPDIVGISLNFLPQLQNTKRLAKAIKATTSRPEIVVGGTCASFMVDQLLNAPGIDYVTLREAEITFLNLIESLENTRRIDTVSGIAYKKNGTIHKTEPRQFIKDLDTLPYPDFEMLHDSSVYRKSIISSRGCPYNCIYCSTRAMWEKWRPRSAAHFFGEFKQLAERYSPKHISFVDDCFLSSKRRVLEFTSLIKEHQLETSWGFSTRLEFLNLELLKPLRECGAKYVYLGIESGSDRVLEQLGRRYSIEEVKYKVSECVKQGILPITSFMVGIPGETEHDVQLTLQALEEVNTPYVQLSVFTPLIGTPVYQSPEKYGIVIDDIDPELISIDDGCIYHSTPDLSKDDILDYWMEGKGIISERFRDVKDYEMLIR